MNAQTQKFFHDLSKVLALVDNEPAAREALAKLLNPDPIRIVVCIDGGRVDHVVTDRPMTVKVLNFEVDGCDGRQWFDQGDGNIGLCTGHYESSNVDAAAVERLWPFYNDSAQEVDEDGNEVPGGRTVSMDNISPERRGDEFMHSIPIRIVEPDHSHD